MDIREPHSFIELFVESFKLINRTFGVVVVFVLVALLGCVALNALLLLHVPQILVGLLNMVYSAFLNVIFIALFVSRAENNTVSLPDLANASVLPAVYLIILGLMVGFVALLGGIVAGVLGSAFPVLVPVVGLPVCVFVMIRCFFAPMAIATREQNPISALVYSWQLTRGRFFYMLGICFISIVTPVFFLGSIGYGLYVSIPLYFADSFDLTNLSALWIGILAVIGLLWVVVSLAMCVYWILVFLNLDYQQNRGHTPSEPLPQAKVTSGTQQPLPAASAPAEPQATADAHEVQILRASIKSHDAEESLSEHLEQVYQPKPEDMVQYAEEDRMPTILFDDEMARQMEADRLKWEQEKEKSRQRAQEKGKDEGPSSIKMSR